MVVRVVVITVDYGSNTFLRELRMFFASFGIFFFFFAGRITYSMQEKGRSEMRESVEEAHFYKN